MAFSKTTLLLISLVSLSITTSLPKVAQALIVDGQLVPLVNIGGTIVCPNLISNLTQAVVPNATARLVCTRSGNISVHIHTARTNVNGVVNIFTESNNPFLDLATCSLNVTVPASACSQTIPAASILSVPLTVVQVFTTSVGDIAIAIAGPSTLILRV